MKRLSEYIKCCHSDQGDCQVCAKNKSMLDDSDKAHEKLMREEREDNIMFFKKLYDNAVKSKNWQQAMKIKQTEELWIRNQSSGQALTSKAWTPSSNGSLKKYAAGGLNQSSQPDSKP